MTLGRRFVVVDGKFDSAPARELARQGRKERRGFLHVAGGIGGKHEGKHGRPLVRARCVNEGGGEESEVVGDLHPFCREREAAFRRNGKPQGFIGGVFAHGLVVPHELQHELVLGFQELCVQRDFGAGALSEELLFQLHRGLQFAI